MNRVVVSMDGSEAKLHDGQVAVVECSSRSTMGPRLLSS
jgi:hypothetical protein